MPASLSVDLRQRVIAAYQAKDGSQRQLAERFKVSLSFVRDLSRHYRQTGTVEPKPHGGGAVAKLAEAQLPLVQELWVGAIVLMDNLPVHQAQLIREALKAAGAKLVFLPPIHQTSHRLSCAAQSSSNFCVLPRLEPGKHSTKR